MSAAPGVITQTLIYAFNHHCKPWEAKQTTRVWEVYSEVARYYPPITAAEELKKRLPNSKRLEADLLSSRKHIYLNPIDRGVFLLPVLTLYCNLRQNDAHYYLGLFLSEAAGDPVKSFGLRFETPSGGGNPGRHSSHHAQFIKGFTTQAPLHGCPSWIPDQEPTLPLNARNPVELLLSVLVSLYGWTYLGELQTAGFGKELKPYIDKMRANA